MDRTPRVFDKVWLYGERLTILQVWDHVPTADGNLNGRIATCDDAGARIERRIDALWWDEDAGAWREVGHTDKWPEGDVVVPLDRTELVP